MDRARCEGAGRPGGAAPASHPRQRSARVRATALAFALLACRSLACPAAAAAEYRLGEGLPLLDDRLLLGGYAAVEASALDRSPDRLVLDHLSAFLTLTLTDRLTVFSETELEESLHVDGGGAGTGDDVLHVERLYAEWRPVDALRLRVGEMLTPIGIWNVIHAAPLVWTTSRPVTTERFFDTEVTGLDATWEASPGGVDLAATVFGQATGHIDDPGDPEEFRRAFGGRLQAEPGRGPRVGVSFVRYDDRSDRRWENTFAADAILSTSLVELSAEVAVNDPDDGATTLGAYAQAVLHATRAWHPFVRLEYLDLPSRERVPVVFGVAWRPTPPLVLKLEGIVGGDDTDLGGEGVLASVAVLF